MSGATVYLEMTLPSGNQATGNANTGTDGTVTFVYQGGSSGTYVSTHIYSPRQFYPKASKDD